LTQISAEIKISCICNNFNEIILFIYQKKEKTVMTVKEIKTIAKKMGIQAGKIKKADLIRTIQNAEGNTPCFQSGATSCDQMNCCWRSDCM
jgi:ABC-type uncharacterized transport system substrate-binding protein